MLLKTCKYTGQRGGVAIAGCNRDFISIPSDKNELHLLFDVQF